VAEPIRHIQDEGHLPRFFIPIFAPEGAKIGMKVATVLLLSQA
jgi:hypothetical protein